MQIEDRLLEADVGLDWIHSEYKRSDPLRQTLSDVQFAYLACQTDISLPEEKVDLAPLHAAGRNLATGKPGWFGGTSIVLVMPMVEAADLAYGYPLTDNAGTFMKEELDNTGIQREDVFVTHAIRFLKPQEVKTFRQGHKNSNAALARADVLGIRPRVAVLVGADAVKAFFGREARIDNMVGSFFGWHGITMFVLPSHYPFLSSHAGLEVFRGHMDRLRDFLVSGSTAPPQKL